MTANLVITVMRVTYKLVDRRDGYIHIDVVELAIIKFTVVPCFVRNRSKEERSATLSLLCHRVSVRGSLSSRVLMIDREKVRPISTPGSLRLRLEMN